jgi:two-component system sensor histidine kinase/response regulator
MQGRIWVESDLGKGSVFHFTARFGVQEAATRSVVPRDSSVLRGMRVLVVDDNMTNRKILSKILAGWGTEPTAVESGAQAIQSLEEFHRLEKHFPLILLDAQMPEMDGFALAESISRNPVWGAPTIMMISSAGQRGDAKRCREIGVAAYLTKPVGQDELLKAILTAMGSQPERETPAAVVTRHSLRENRRQLRILLAEDNAVNQKLAVRLLEKRGHTVTVAANGKEALDALQNHTFDLVLMDVQMPEMDGFEATAAIRELEKKSGEHLLVIAMTAHAMVGDRERCLAAGMDDYMTKPIRPEELNEMLTRYSAKVSTERVL